MPGRKDSIIAQREPPRRFDFIFQSRFGKPIFRMTFRLLPTPYHLPAAPYGGIFFKIGTLRQVKNFAALPPQASGSGYPRIEIRLLRCGLPALRNLKFAAFQFRIFGFVEIGVFSTAKISVFPP